MKIESCPNVRAVETCVLLRRGRAGRRVTVTLVTRSSGEELGAPPGALSAFLRAVDAELFGPAGPLVAATPVHVERSPGIVVHVLDTVFPKLRPDVFWVLVRMVERSVPEAVKLVIREEGPEAALVVRRLDPDHDTAATIADVEWKIVLPFSGPPAVTVEFQEDVPEAIASLALDRLTAWAEVVALGGFPGPGVERVSRARVRERGRLGPRSVGLKLDVLACAHEGVEVLFEGLCGVHERASIAAVSVTSGLLDPREGGTL